VRVDGMWPADESAVALPRGQRSGPLPARFRNLGLAGATLAHDRARDWKVERKRRDDELAGGPRRRMCPSRHHATR
jgi:hypothetical protein